MVGVVDYRHSQLTEYQGLVEESCKRYHYRKPHRSLTCFPPFLKQRLRFSYFQVGFSDMMLLRISILIKLLTHNTRLFESNNRNVNLFDVKK